MRQFRRVPLYRICEGNAPIITLNVHRFDKPYTMAAVILEMCLRAGATKPLGEPIELEPRELALIDELEDRAIEIRSVLGCKQNWNAS